MTHALPLATLTVGFQTDKGLSAIQHKADAFTKIDMIPGQMVVIQKTSRVDGSISIVEIFAGGNTMFWEYTILQPKAVEAVDKAIAAITEDVKNFSP